MKAKFKIFNSTVKILLTYLLSCKVIAVFSSNESTTNTVQQEITIPTLITKLLSETKDHIVTRKYRNHMSSSSFKNSLIT